MAVILNGTESGVSIVK